MGGLSLIDATWFPAGSIVAGQNPRPADNIRPQQGFIAEYGETVD
jgi:hypothetical protein